MILAAVWLRVSTNGQETDNQVPDVERFLGHHGYSEVRRFVLDDSAWKNGNGGPAYRCELKAALDGAWAGEYRVIVVWALDRITRLGAEDALRLIRQFRERGCTLLSVRESWLNGSPEIQDVLVAFAGWMAQQESAWRSVRIKAGIARRAAADPSFRPGRQPGAVDLKKRRTTGYMGNTNGARTA